MWDSAPKYKLYCVIKGNVSYPNSKKELLFNTKEGKQNTHTSLKTPCGCKQHASVDGSRDRERIWGRGARRQKGRGWRMFTAGTQTLSTTISSACHCTPLLFLSDPRRHRRDSGQLCCPTCNIWKVIFGSWFFFLILFCFCFFPPKVLQNHQWDTEQLLFKYVTAPHLALAIWECCPNAVNLALFTYTWHFPNYYHSELPKSVNVMETHGQ